MWLQWFHLSFVSLQEIVDWYTAIRAATYHNLRIAYPTTPIPELLPLLAQDFVKEGFLHKTGSKVGDEYKKRWFTLHRRVLLYFEDQTVHPCNIKIILYHLFFFIIQIEFLVKGSVRQRRNILAGKAGWIWTGDRSSGRTKTVQVWIHANHAGTQVASGSRKRTGAPRVDVRFKLRDRESSGTSRLLGYISTKHAQLVLIQENARIFCNRQSAVVFAGFQSQFWLQF